VAPAGTPPAIVAELNAAITESIAQPEIKSQLERLGATPATGTPEEFAAFFAAENRKWVAVVKSVGVSLD
jgi:tripartite-type tricarboxylate transporter receptor subunit TctC